MKPYGIPRTKDVEYPDVSDIQKYGLKTSVGGKCCQRSKNKAISRRYWKKVERKKAIDNILEELGTKKELEMRYSKNKTYFTKMNSAKELMKKIEDVSSVLWASGQRPTEYRPYDKKYCFYNGSSHKRLTCSCEEYLIENYIELDEFINLNENEFIEMLSELEPKRS
jgi:hypothetical protein